jgi:hypothetical protein
MNRLTRPDDETWGQLKAKIQSAENSSVNETEILESKLKTALNNRTITISKDSRLLDSYKSTKKAQKK